MEFFDAGDSTSIDADKPGMIPWFYNTITEELEQAFIKSPGLSYYETYILVMASLVMIWLFVTNLHMYIKAYWFTEKREENIHFTLLKDDLLKCAPYKKNPKGQLA